MLFCFFFNVSLCHWKFSKTTSWANFCEKSQIFWEKRQIQHYNTCYDIFKKYDNDTEYQHPLNILFHHKKLFAFSLTYFKSRISWNLGKGGVTEFGTKILEMHLILKNVNRKFNCINKFITVSFKMLQKSILLKQTRLLTMDPQKYCEPTLN